MDTLAYAIPIGAGATAVMDIWGVARARLFGVPAANYGLVGRWLAYMPRGRFRHEGITASPPVKWEGAIGWIAHYAIGIAFAGLLLLLVGPRPTLASALMVGVGTVVAPFLLMQPGMGAGIAASRTPRPRAARLQSVVTHAVFGVGLYIAASIVNLLRG